MAYFQELPNISYPSLLSANNKVEDRIIVKNLFKRSKLRSDVDQAITAFNYYYIEQGMRPDTLAQELYGDSELDWVVFLPGRFKEESILRCNRQGDSVRAKVIG